MHQAQPRLVTSVLVEEAPDGVTVTWGLGDSIPGDVEFFGYGVDYYDANASNGKRFGVRFGSEPTAHVFEWSSATQANYTADSIAVTGDSIVVFYVDASIGVDELGQIEAFSHLNGQDVQTGLPVTLLR
jgi:hypothetical protein